MKQKKLSSRSLRYLFIFAALLGVQLLLLLLAGLQKDGFNIDDMLSFLLANSLYRPYLQYAEDFYTQWHETEYFMHAITTYSQSSRFNYDSVTYNQSLDVHPPLYYYALHTVCSIFTGVFSKWLGLSVNFIFFVGSSILLYLLAALFFKQFALRLLPLVLWGFSIGTFSTFLLIRMYMMLCFVTLLYLYIHLRYISGKKLNARRAMLVVASILIGFLTHYYFLIFAFFLVVGECLTRLAKKDIAHMLLFGISSSIAVGLGFAIYPAAYNHIFSEYQGENAISNFFSISEYLTRLAQTAQSIALPTWIGFLCSAALPLCLLALCICPKANAFLRSLCLKVCPHDCSALVARTFITAFAAVGTFFLVVILGGYAAERYLYYTYPVLALLFAIVLGFAVSALPMGCSKQQALALVAALCFVGSGWVGNTPSYLESESAAAIASAQIYSDASCIIVLEQPYNYVGHFIELATYEQTLLVRTAEFYNLTDTLSEIEDDQLMLYLPAGSDIEKYFSYLEENYGYTSAQALWSYSYSAVYLVTR